MTIVADSATDAYYQGPSGIMQGGSTFFASALFLLAGIGTGADQVIFANTDTVNPRGWVIGVRNVAGVPTLFVQIGDGVGPFERTFALPESLGKIVLVHLAVTNDVLDVVINSNAAIVSVPIPNGAKASTGFPTVGAGAGGFFPASQIGIAGVGYSVLPGDAVIAENHMTRCRGIYDFADLFAGVGPSWTHWYTARRGVVVPGSGATFTGPLLTGFPQASPIWQAAAGSGVGPDVEERVALTRQGASSINPLTLVLDNPLWAPIDMDAQAGGGDARVFSVDFTDGDLAAGVLSINHNLGDTRIASVTIRDDSGEALGGPDSDTVVDANNVNVDLSSFQPLNGTWTATVVGA